MVDRGLADIVRLAAGLRHDRVRRAGEHDRRRQILRAQHAPRLVDQHVVAGDVDGERATPHRLWCAGARLRRRIDGGGIDDDIDAAELEDRRAQHRRHAVPG